MNKLQQSRIWRFLIIAFICFLSTFEYGCKKLVEIDSPVTSVNETNVYKSDVTAIGVLTGIYGRMSASNGIFSGVTSISLMAGLSSDEWLLGSNVSDQKLIAYYQNALNAIQPQANQQGEEFWEPLYSFIYSANTALEGIENSKTLSESVRKQLLGEAKFVRAFCYFYLVNLFGDVPLIINSDYKINSLQKRASSAQIYDQVITDLKDAQELLSSEYINGNLKPYGGIEERTRPTKWAATALLARVFLYTDKWSNAEEQATLLINNLNIFDTVSLNNVFLKNSKESIWQLQPTQLNFNTSDAIAFVIPSTGFSNQNPVALSILLQNAFEPGDKRFVINNWVNKIAIGSNNYVYPFKYKINTSNTSINPITGTTNMSEFLMVLRLGEQYLIRSEARAHLGNIGGAQDDLNVIRRRAGLAATTATNASSLIAAIQQERRVELFSEWGHRWFDLKRTGNIDQVMNTASLLKGGNWQPFKALYPIPTDDIFRNANLTQNIGY